MGVWTAPEAAARLAAMPHSILRFHLAKLLLGLAVFAAPLYAQVQFSTLGSFSDSTAYLQPGQSQATSFTTDNSDYLLTGITFDLYRVGSTDPFGFSTSLYLSDANGLPTGSALTTFSPTTLAAFSRPVAFTPDGTVTLQANTEYVFVMSSDSSSAVNVGINLISGASATVQPSGSSWTTRGQEAVLNAGASTWSTYNGYAYIYSVSASAVPEPSTYAILAGLAVLLFVFYRRRRQTVRA